MQHAKVQVCSSVDPDQFYNASIYSFLVDLLQLQEEKPAELPYCHGCNLVGSALADWGIWFYEQRLLYHRPYRKVSLCMPLRDDLQMRMPHSDVSVCRIGCQLSNTVPVALLVMMSNVVISSVYMVDRKSQRGP
jgi:hypothetical protein